MKFFHPLPQRWLSLGIALFTGSAALHAQVHPAPGVNLFGDEVVKKLKRDPGMRFFRPTEPEANDSAPQKIEGYAHALIFQDGSQLRGEIVALNKKELLWSRPDVSEPIRFLRSDIRKIILTPSATRTYHGQVVAGDGKEPPEDKSKSGLATVKLPGGDWLHGDLSSEDGKTFSLKIGDQTTFTFGREAISWLYSGAQPAPAFAFSGRALDAEGWLEQSPSAQIEVKDGTLTTKANTWIGRSVASFRRFEMTFEIPEDAEEYTQVWLQPHGPSVNSYSSGTVLLHMRRQEFRHTAYSNRMVTIRTPIPKEMSEAVGPVRYRILYDGIGERMLVFRNGHQLGDWKFRTEEEKKQFAQREFQVSGICFQRQFGQNRPLKLNRIDIRPWDGMFSPDELVTGEGDCLISSGGKMRVGHLGALTKDGVVFSGENWERKTGTFVQFAHDADPLAESDAVLLFGDNGELSTADMEVSGGKARFRTVFAPAMEASLASLQTIAFPIASKKPEAKPADLLVFKNGDELPGFLISAVNGEPWRWQTMEGQEFTIRPDHIAGFRSFAGDITSAPTVNAATVELRNGDRLRGDLAGFTDGKIEFRHTQLGAFGLPQDHLWSLYPNPKLLLTDGSQQPAKWMGLDSDKSDTSGPFGYEVATGNRWIYLDGSYLLRSEVRNDSSAGQLVTSLKEIPERYELRFDVTSISGSEPSVILSMTSAQDSGRLQAQLSHGRLYAYAYSRKSQSSRSKQIEFVDKLQDPTSRRNIRVFVDAKLGTADIFLDGVFLIKIGQQVSERLPGLGDTIRMQAYPQQASVVVSNIWLGPWNGELPTPSSEPTPATSLTNGDVAMGAPKDFRDGKLLLESEIGPLELPMDRVLAVEFGGTLSSKPAHARVRLTDGCAISLETFHWEGGQLIARSEVLGDLQIPAKLISELVLAPSPPRTPKTPPVKQVAQEGGQ